MRLDDFNVSSIKTANKRKKVFAFRLKLLGQDSPPAGSLAILFKVSFSISSRVQPKKDNPWRNWLKIRDFKIQRRDSNENVV